MKLLLIYMEKKELNSSLEPKIVVYDSGLGGVETFNRCKKNYSNVFYFCDTENFPYGNKPFNVLKDIFINNILALGLRADDLLVLACNTISCVYKAIIKTFKVPCLVLSVLDFLLSADKNNLIICTSFTSNYLQNLGHRAQKMPLLATLIENDSGGEIFMYLQGERLLPNFNKVIYGCTHYPIIDGLFQQIYPEIHFVDPSSDLFLFIEKWVNNIGVNKKLINSF